LAERGYVTVSIGIAAAAVGEPGTPQQLVAAADARLYQAKRAGRNQVTGGPTG
jgi:diguanylate cyclase (GGDEF)-like protein